MLVNTQLYSKHRGFWLCQYKPTHTDQQNDQVTPDYNGYYGNSFTYGTFRYCYCN